MAPAYWSPDLEQDPLSELGEEQCVIEEEHFFVRAIVRIPVIDAEQHVEWGVWVSLSRENFLRISEAWEEEGRESTAPMFGWLSTALGAYPTSTLNLKTMVHTQPVGLRPLGELEQTDHPLAIEQRQGIGLARVREFAEILRHGE